MRATLALMEQSPKPVVLSRETVLDLVAHAFAQNAVDAVQRHVLPFGELRWTGWKAAQERNGLVGQLLLWVYDADKPRDGREQRQYVVSLPGGAAQRYAAGDSFELLEWLRSEQLSLAINDRDGLEQMLQADFVRAVHALVDCVVADWPEMVARLVWRGIKASSLGQGLHMSS